MATFNRVSYRLVATLIAIASMAVVSIAPITQVQAASTINDTVPTRPTRDLGDAPDSSNHHGVAMSAYGGVPASFPTVFDPATGAVRGPAHDSPRPFHLGELVSREAEADVGPDEDPVNNIRPAVNTPNRDRFDDGARPDTWNPTSCAKATLPVKVFINQQAADWFTRNETKGYVNIWLDINRDGDWADAFTCQDQRGRSRTSPEHIVIDAPVNVIGLGVGTHIVQTVSGYIMWPTAMLQQSRWVRVSLSERPSIKPLMAGDIKYGDGRGPNTPFKLGETEDYLARLTGTGD